MKTLLSILSIISLALFASCGGNESGTEDTNGTDGNASAEN